MSYIHRTPPKKYSRSTVRDRVPVKLHLILLSINLVLKFIPDSNLIIIKENKLSKSYSLTQSPCSTSDITHQRSGNTIKQGDCESMSPVAAASTLAAVPDVDIDPSGRFKYILMKVYDPSNRDAYKMIVRGFARHHFHMDIMDEVEPGITRLGLKCECPGGGRIQHDAQRKTIKVFGYSTAFGQPDHSISVEVLRKKYPEYDITWSNEGY